MRSICFIVSFVDLHLFFLIFVACFYDLFFFRFNNETWTYLTPMSVSLFVVSFWKCQDTMVHPRVFLSLCRCLANRSRGPQLVIFESWIFRIFTWWISRKITTAIQPQDLLALASPSYYCLPSSGELQLKTCFFRKMNHPKWVRSTLRQTMFFICPLYHQFYYSYSFLHQPPTPRPQLSWVEFTKQGPPPTKVSSSRCKSTFSPWGDECRVWCGDISHLQRGRAFTVKLGVFLLWISNFSVKTAHSIWVPLGYSPVRKQPEKLHLLGRILGLGEVNMFFFKCPSFLFPKLTYWQDLTSISTLVQEKNK